MKRRQFLQTLAAAGLSCAHPLLSQPARSSGFDPYTGNFYVTINADGGWDVTSFCDPKQNTTINKWAVSQSTQTINGSPISYAPFAHNATFFQNHHDKMLIINGIDSQTNAHEAGVRHTWSGRLEHGFPTFSALAAATLSPNQPLAYISNGGYKETAGITQYTLMKDPTSLKKLVFPNQFLDFDPSGNWDAPRQYHRQGAMDLINQAKSDRLNRLRAQSDRLPKQVNSLRDLLNARIGADQLAPLADTMPETLVDNVDIDGEWNPLLRQAQIALATYKAGLTVAADLTIWGFDTHSDHDIMQDIAIKRLQRGIDYLWQEAERIGVDHKLVVLISSEFGRTPKYNDGNGKDHWPISSSIIMSKNKSWTNKVAGITDANHEAKKININSLAADANGIILEPKHIQQAMRKLAGIDQHEICQRFDLQAEDVNLFS